MIATPDEWCLSAQDIKQELKSMYNHTLMNRQHMCVDDCNSIVCVLTTVKKVLRFGKDPEEPRNVRCPSFQQGHQAIGGRIMLWHGYYGDKMGWCEDARAGLCPVWSLLFSPLQWSIGDRTIPQDFVSSFSCSFKLWLYLSENEIFKSIAPFASSGRHLDEDITCRLSTNLQILKSW